MSDLFYVETNYDWPFNEMIVEEDTYLPILLSGFRSSTIPNENILYKILWVKNDEGKWLEYGNEYCYGFCIAFPEQDIHNWIQVYESNKDTLFPHCYTAVEE